MNPLTKHLKQAARFLLLGGAACLLGRCASSDGTSAASPRPVPGGGWSNPMFPYSAQQTVYGYSLWTGSEGSGRGWVADEGLSGSLP